MDFNKIWHDMFRDGVWGLFRGIGILLVYYIILIVLSLIPTLVIANIIWHFTSYPTPLSFFSIIISFFFIGPAGTYAVIAALQKKINNTAVKENEVRLTEHNHAIEYFNKLCQRYILFGTDAWVDLYSNSKIIGDFCKKNHTAILMPGIQFNELESLNFESALALYNKTCNKEELLKKIADLVQSGLVKIEGLNYSPTKTRKNETIDALVKFAEKAVQENTPFVYVTDDPALIVRINCLSKTNNTIEIHSISEVESMLDKF